MFDALSGKQLLHGVSRNLQQFLTNNPEKFNKKTCLGF